MVFWFFWFFWCVCFVCLTNFDQPLRCAQTVKFVSDFCNGFISAPPSLRMVTTLVAVGCIPSKILPFFGCVCFVCFVCFICFVSFARLRWLLRHCRGSWRLCFPNRHRGVLFTFSVFRFCGFCLARKAQERRRILVQRVSLKTARSRLAV